MQLNTHNNLTVIAGYEPAHRPQPHRTHQDREDDHPANRPLTPLEGQILPSQGFSESTTARVRQTNNSQPLFDQQLTQSGEQARRAYQTTALTGDVELTNRLDEIA